MFHPTLFQTFLIDTLLAISLAIAIGVFLIGLFMEHPLQFSAFPAVILVATLLRLSVNVATTRLILLHGHEGEDAAGAVIATFGRFVVGGNIVHDSGAVRHKHRGRDDDDD